MLRSDRLININLRQLNSTILQLNNAQPHIKQFLLILPILNQHLLHRHFRMNLADQHWIQWRSVEAIILVLFT